MDIYIVLYRTDEGYGWRETKHSTFSDQTRAKEAAVSAAQSIDGDSLYEILKLNTDTRKVTKYDLVLEKGRFELKQIRKEDK